MRIKQFRISSKLTQDAVANQLGITRSTVAMWESGKSIPTARLLPKLAVILNCTVDDLLKEE